MDKINPDENDIKMKAMTAEQRKWYTGDNQIKRAEEKIKKLTLYPRDEESLIKQVEDWKMLACMYEILLDTACQVLVGILPDMEYAWGDEEKVAEFVRKGKQVITQFELINKR
jgi:hypothetical protein